MAQREVWFLSHIKECRSRECKIDVVYLGVCSSSSHHVSVPAKIRKKEKDIYPSFKDGVHNYMQLSAYISLAGS